MRKFCLLSPAGGCYGSLASAKSGAGIGVPEFTRAHNRAQCGFFVCETPLYLSMVRRVGLPKGRPGSLVTGYANPARLTTSEIGVSRGELSGPTREAAAMATTPTPLHPQFSAISVQGGMRHA